MVTKKLKSAAIACLTSFLALSPLSSISQDYAYLPKINPSLPESRSYSPTETKPNPSTSTNRMYEFALQDELNTHYEFSPQPKDELERYLLNFNARTDWLMEQSLFSDPNLRVNFSTGLEGNDYKDYLEKKYLGMTKSAARNSLRHTQAYQNVQSQIQTKLIEPLYIEEITQFLAKNVARVFVSKENAEKWSRKIQVQADFVDESDRFFMYPLMQREKDTYTVSLSPSSLRIGEESGIEFRIDPLNGGSAIYRNRILGGSGQLFFGGNINLWDIKPLEGKAGMEGANWGVFSGANIDIWGDWKLGVEVQTSSKFNNNNEPNQNTSGRQTTSAFISIFKRL